MYLPALLLCLTLEAVAGLFYQPYISSPVAAVPNLYACVIGIETPVPLFMTDNVESCVMDSNSLGTVSVMAAVQRDVAKTFALDAGALSVFPVNTTAIMIRVATSEGAKFHSSLCEAAKSNELLTVTQAIFDSGVVNRSVDGAVSQATLVVKGIEQRFEFRAILNVDVIDTGGKCERYDLLVPAVQIALSEDISTAIGVKVRDVGVNTVMAVVGGGFRKAKVAMWVQSGSVDAAQQATRRVSGRIDLPKTTVAVRALRGPDALISAMVIDQVYLDRKVPDEACGPGCRTPLALCISVACVVAVIVWIAMGGSPAEDLEHIKEKIVEREMQNRTAFPYQMSADVAQNVVAHNFNEKLEEFSILQRSDQIRQAEREEERKIRKAMVAAAAAQTPHRSYRNKW